MRSNKLIWILFFAFLAVFLAIESRGLKPQQGDENVYFYMGKLVSEGLTPYKDFFYAHQPLQLYLIAGIFKIFGFNTVVLKLLPLLSTAITAILLFIIVKEKFGNIEAVVSSVLFLFSYSTLFNSVFAFGVSEATMFLFFGLYFYYIRKNNLAAGVFFGLALLTRLLLLLPLLYIFFKELFTDKKGFVKMAIGLSMTFVLVNIIFIALFGYSYINPVYKYHLVKGYEISRNFSEYTNVVKLNWMLFLSWLAFILLRHKKILDFFSISVIYLALLIFLSRVFSFYFVPVVPFMAIVGGYTIANLLKRVSTKKLMTIISILLIALLLWDLSANLRFLFGTGFNGFQRGTDIADFINSQFDDSYYLFGDDSSAPLIAMMTGKKIIHNFVDTNPSVYKSGIVDAKKVLTSLLGYKTIFIIRSMQGISELPETIFFINKRCNFVSAFNDKLEGDYIIYDCR